MPITRCLHDSLYFNELMGDAGSRLIGLLLLGRLLVQAKPMGTL